MSLSKIALYGLLTFSVIIILNTNFITPALAQQVLHLEPIDDAFVLNDKNDPEDVHGYQQTNTGDLDFLKFTTLEFLLKKKLKEGVIWVSHTYK